MSTVTVLALVGSLRAGSHNRQLAEAAAHHAPDGVEVVIHEGLRDVPFYDEDIDVPGSEPRAAVALRDAVAAADALILFSPEYNGSTPAVLKNAIDWLSRPMGSGAVVGKPTAVIGTAYGQYGGVWAQDETRKSAGIAGAATLPEVTLSIPESVVRFAETHPRDDAEVAEQVAEVVTKVADAAREAVAA